MEPILVGKDERKASTKTKLTADNFTEMMCNFIPNIQAFIGIEEISSYRIINWDHSALKYVPVAMAKEGAKKVL